VFDQVPALNTLRETAAYLLMKQNVRSFRHYCIRLSVARTG